MRSAALFFLYNVYNLYMCYYRVSSEICQCSTTRSCHVRETHFLVKPPGLFRKFDGADKKESVTCPFSSYDWLAVVLILGTNDTRPYPAVIKTGFYEMPLARCCILSLLSVSLAATWRQTRSYFKSEYFGQLTVLAFSPCLW